MAIIHVAAIKEFRTSSGGRFGLFGSIWAALGPDGFHTGPKIEPEETQATPRRRPELLKRSHVDHSHIRGPPTRGFRSAPDPRWSSMVGRMPAKLGSPHTLGSLPSRKLVCLLDLDSVQFHSPILNLAALKLGVNVKDIHWRPTRPKSASRGQVGRGRGRGRGEGGLPPPPPPPPPHPPGAQHQPRGLK